MTKRLRTIVITGASGFIGQALVKHFSHTGWNVKALVRSPATCTKLKNVQYIAYDMARPISDDSLKRTIFKGAYCLIHAAYVKDDAKHTNALAVNITATEQLVRLSHEHGFVTCIFLSSMSARQDAASTYGRQKFQSELLFNGNNDVIIRPGLVIGNGGLMKQIINFMTTKHVVPIIDGGDQPLQVVAIYDLIKAIDIILTKQLCGSFTVATPEVYRYREFYNLLRQQLRIKAWLVPVAFFIPLYSIRLINLLHLPVAITEDNLQGLKQLQAVNTLADLETLGMQLDTLDIILKRYTMRDNS